MKPVGLALLCGLALGAANSAASLTTAQTGAIDDLIRRALEEQKVFATCSATLPAMNGQLVADMWEEMADETIELLLEIGYPLDRIAQFRANAAPGQDLLPAATPWSDVVAFCQESGNWMRKLQMMRMIFLPSEIKKVL